MEDAALINRAVSAFAEGTEELYRRIYLYGKESACEAAAKKLVEEYKAAHPKAELCGFTGNSFVSEALDNVMNGSRFAETGDPFVSLLSSCGLFVLENIQDAAGKTYSMERLYIILDKRLERDRPFLITGNTVPSGIQGLAPRLRAILEGSLMLGLS